jgi:hypothetical protein
MTEVRAFGKGQDGRPIMVLTWEDSVEMTAGLAGKRRGTNQFF